LDWRPPGILGLWRLILETFEALEADFARHYHLELAELVFGGESVPLRRLRNLIVHLPPDSAFVRTVAPRLPATPAPWSTGDNLLALIAELVDANTRAFISAYSKPNSPAPKPIKIPRPDDGSGGEAGPVSMSSPEARTFFAGSVRYTPPEETLEEE
jgi:hypothetical protein